MKGEAKKGKRALNDFLAGDPKFEVKPLVIYTLSIS